MGSDVLAHSLSRVYKGHIRSTLLRSGIKGPCNYYPVATFRQKPQTHPETEAPVQTQASESSGFGWESWCLTCGFGFRFSIQGLVLMLIVMIMPTVMAMTMALRMMLVTVLVMVMIVMIVFIVPLCSCADEGFGYCALSPKLDSRQRQESPIEVPASRSTSGATRWR